MQLKVAEFTPAKNKLTKVPLITASNSEHVFQSQCPAPIALPRIDLINLKEKCETHAKDMASTMYGSCTVATGGIEGITSSLLQAIGRYHKTTSLDSVRDKIPDFCVVC